MKTLLPAAFALLTLAAAPALLPSAAAQPPPPTCANRDFSVYFDEWKADLTPEARDAIATVQRDLQGCAIEHVRIVGLAGAKGDDTDNMRVSMARAQAIAAALAAGGWPADHFELLAMGEANATVDGAPSPMRRRAHIIVRAAPPASS